MPEKTIQLTPVRRAWFWLYFWGVVLTPFLGIGLLLIYRAEKSYRSMIYVLSDQSITTIDSRITSSIDIINITDIKIQRRWIDKQLKVGTLLLITENRTVSLFGIKNPEKLSGTILKAVEAKKLHAKERRKRLKSVPETHPGRIDKIDYLTGLWQQGLISNEEFKKEKKNFE